MSQQSGIRPDVPAADRSERLRSWNPADFPVPIGREEEWRFTPMSQLRDLLTEDASAVVGSGSVSVEVKAPSDVKVERVAHQGAQHDSRLGTVGVPAERVAALAFSATATATVLTVPQDTQLTEPIVVRAHGNGSAGADFGHVLLQVEALASAVVVLDHVGSATYADNLEIRVGDQGHLTVVSLLDWDVDAVHLSAHHIEVGRDARVVHVVVSLGGEVIRTTPEVTFAGPGGDIELLGLFFTDPNQHHEHRIFVDHSEPNCRSNVNYKGALIGEGAHSVWIGDVLIRAGAVGTETYEINRNLLLSDGPRADSVPNLEIETGDVASAGHASVTGRLDGDQLFYLMARGIPELEARRLVVTGFFAELRDRIGVAFVTERLTAALETELQRATSS
ncbi:MAG: Fe-S cluster assembly protein SufD [Actinomycetia bacterium]|nr:Fe-S cluster assembly protein SufD [Actinomycetes bacterium]